MSRHAQESRTVKIAKSPRITLFLETAPLLALVGIAFVGSCGNVLHFFGACGITGVVQYGDTGCPDLLCLVAVREYLRDRRLGRIRKWGWVSWPILVLLIGIAMTLALGYIGNDKTMLAHIAGSPVGHMAGPLPGAVLLLALSLFHRRDSGTAAAAAAAKRKRQPEAAPVAASAPLTSEAVALPPVRQGSVGENASSGQQHKVVTIPAAGEPDADAIDIYAEALKILAEDPDITGAELGRRLGRTPSRGRQIMRSLAGTAPRGLDEGAS
jgi:hypothetical protein